MTIMGSCFRPKIATAKRFSRFRSTLPLPLPCSKPNNIQKPIFFNYHNAIAAFEGMLIEDPTPPTHEFNHLLSSIAKTFPKTNGVVVDSYTEMLKMGISLDLVSYNILMKCYADAKLLGSPCLFLGKFSN
ncbi:TPR superfamily protein, putative [Medicago truncatula]|uniref:TPR superfamily protein, putative n=1 Tax=Medicago truncatula TaxID=3880 RepID=A0A072VIB7_MEDTR|nr:TPR superfamily protein, putative [Medicago truncatula]